MELLAIIALATVALMQNLTLRSLEAKVKDLESRPYRILAGGRE